MSWFGMGGGKKPDEDHSREQNMKIDTFDNFSPSATEFSAPSSGNYAAAPSASAGLGGFEQEVMMEQQKAMIQAVMFKLTDAAFDACVTKPSTSLSSSEQSCISAVVGKYLETTELVVGRLQGQK